MTKNEIIEFFETIEKLEKHGALVDVEVVLEDVVFFDSILVKTYSNFDKDVLNTSVQYGIYTGSRIS